MCAHFGHLCSLDPKALAQNKKKTLMYVLGTKTYQVIARRPKACFNNYYEIKKASY